MFVDDKQLASMIPAPVYIPEDLNEFNIRGVNIKWFGAIGGRTVDCSKAIRNAIEYIKSKGGGILFIPGESFKITEVIECPSNITIKGEGFNSELFIPSGCYAMLRWSATKKNVICEDFKITYESPILDSQDVHPLRFSWTTNVIVQRVYIENAPLSSIDFSSCTDIQVNNCYCVTSGQGCITATNTRGITIANNILRPGVTKNANNVSPTGVDVGQNSKDVTITGNVVYDCYYGIYFRDDIERLICQGNVIKNCIYDGIAVVLETGTKSIINGSISNNVIEEVDRNGIDLRSTVNVIVSGNIIKNCANRGIWILSYNENLVISQNNISLCGYHGIDHQENNNINTLIEGNTCYRNGNGENYAGIYNNGDTRILNNYCYDNSSNQLQKYGIWTNGLTPTINGNVCFNNLTSQIYIQSGSAKGVNIENYNVISIGSTITDLGKDWNGRHLALGGYRLWVDGSGKLRIKSGAPTSDSDGVVVGTQS